jgi:AbrB family looped-hinge helix DNA binding protein
MALCFVYDKYKVEWFMIDACVKISEGGRIVIPAEFRKALGIDIGDELILHLEHGRMTLLTRKQAVLYVQEQAAQYTTAKDSLLSEQLIAERRKEATDE